jgi:RNA polymerase sigma-70 factor (ECF subfamily)
VLWLLHEPDIAPAADSFLETDPDLANSWKRLTSAQQELLALVIVEGLPVQDVAVVMGTTPNAVSIRLHRAKKQLAEGLEKSQGERLSGEGT